MVEVFKTNVMKPDQAHTLLKQLVLLVPEYKINFDLEDCDKVMRVEYTYIAVNTIVSFLQQQGFICEVLE